MRRGFTGLTLVALLLAASPYGAAAPAPGQVPVQVSGARIRWLPGDLPLAGYFVIRNTGDQALRLVGASSPAFRRIMLHRTVSYGRMKPVQSLVIAAGWAVQFDPGGYHLMLMGRTRPLQRGDEVPITLRFAGGGTVKVMFRVLGADLR